MATLDDFMAFNFIEDEREQQEADQTTEYPYQSQYWDDDDSSSDENEY